MNNLLANNLDLFQLWRQYQDFLASSDFSSLMNTLKTIGVTATVVMGFLFVWILLKMRGFLVEKVAEKVAGIETGLNPPSKGEGKYDAKWKEVKEHIASAREAEWKFAVIEADKIVEEILNQAGFPGETMGEQLTLITPEQLASLNDLWSAHKLRNLIAHDPNYKVNRSQAKEAVENYEKALRELGVLG